MSRGLHISLDLVAWQGEDHGVLGVPFVTNNEVMMTRTLNGLSGSLRLAARSRQCPARIIAWKKHYRRSSVETGVQGI